MQAGKLYLCATPIGNLEDMTYRAVRLLKEAALIAAEDTRHTRKLLTHFDIHTPLISYHEHIKDKRGPELIERLLNGEDVAVVSDAGLPGISDPGSHLVRLALDAGLTVVPVPGANAALTALVAAGLDTTAFTFAGFLPKTGKKRRAFIRALSDYQTTLVLYESPHRLKATLAELLEELGDRPAVAARELTKKFEEFIRGTLKSLQQHFSENQPRGEFTLVINGNDNGKAEPLADVELPPVEQAVAALISAGYDKKAAIREVAASRAVPRREVYQAVIGKEL